MKKVKIDNEAQARSEIEKYKAIDAQMVREALYLEFANSENDTILMADVCLRLVGSELVDNKSARIFFSAMGREQSEKYEVDKVLEVLERRRTRLSSIADMLKLNSAGR